MRLFCVGITLLFIFAGSSVVFAEDSATSCSIASTLRLRSRGNEVRCLQLKLGAVPDGKFGPSTLAFVKLFQTKNGLVADGVVGFLSRAALNQAASQNTQNTMSATSPMPPRIATASKAPKVTGVFPQKVRSGDVVKISGENFLPNGNTVRLRYAQIEARFENLSSGEGKTISFVFQPPDVKTMSKEELLSLPNSILRKILDPLEALGGSIDDIIAPYRNMNSEDDLRQFLERNGHTLDELYDKFYVTVENSQGRGSSSGPILSGLRKLSFGSLALEEKNENFLKDFLSFFGFFAPQKAHAQLPEGGSNSGVIMYCTCGPGYLTTMTDLSSNGGSGLYWWSPGFVPNVGNPLVPGPQLGFYVKNAGMCWMAASPCYFITANVAALPWGEGL